MGLPAALEGVEDPADIVRMDPDARILHLNFRHRIAEADTQRDMALAGEFDRIGQKIDQDLAQALLVGEDDTGQGWRLLEDEVDALALGLKPEHADDLVEKIVDLHLVPVQMQAAGLDLRDVEQALDQPGQMFGRCAG